MYKRYLHWLLLFFAVHMCFVVFNYFFLLHRGELTTLQAIVERQKEDFCIYGTALHDDMFDYKLAGFAARKPTVVALGSSRVMQFRERYFSDSFFNLGGGIHSIEEGQRLVDAMLSMHTPAVAIIGIDFWWFNAAITPTTADNTPPRLNASTLFYPYMWLVKGKISMADYTERNWKKHHQCLFGMQAVKHLRGFGSDGSYYYTDRVTGHTDSNDENFSATLEKIRLSKEQFVFGSADPNRLKTFAHMVEQLKSAGVTPIIVIPPVAPEVYEALERQSSDYPVRQQIRAFLRQNQIAFLDMEDPATIPASHCEFIDGFHGGDVVYTRMLPLIAQHIPSLVREDRIQTTLANAGGKAMIPDARVTDEPEVDFLRLGCKK